MTATLHTETKPVTDSPVSTPLITRVQRLNECEAGPVLQYVQNTAAATAYHQPAWLDAISQAYGHPAWIITAWRGEKLCGYLPLCHVRRPIGRGSLVSLPYCDLGGILADDDAASDAIRRSAGELSHKLGVGPVELRQLGQRLGDDADIEPEGNTPAPKVSMRCTLPETSEALLKGFKAKLRSQIRKAEKNGLLAEVTTGPAAIERFYEVFAANMQRLGSPVHSLAWFQSLSRAYGDSLVVGLVYHEKVVVGAGIVLMQGNGACIPWASTLAEYNRLAPNMLLYWELLRHVCDLGCREFDFGRSSLGEGTYRFKRQWGAEPYALNWDRLNTDGTLLDRIEWATPPSWVPRVRALIESIWQRLPMSLANRLGPRIRKYITL